MHILYHIPYYGRYLAKLMGVPVGTIVCATNSNDIVHRVLSAGDMHMRENVVTLSPAMDIQVGGYHVISNLTMILHTSCDGRTHTSSSRTTSSG